MTEEEIARIQLAYLVEFGHLDNVAHAMLYSRRGEFVRRFAMAWLQADAENKRLLKPTWEVLIDKYGLEEELERGPLP